MQRQLGLPQLFFTLSPYEWSFPYHKWVVDEMEKALRPRLHLPAAETLHLAHVLHQLVEGWITGMNSVSTGDARRNWKVQLLRGDNNEKVVINFCARLEFQDGKRKKPKYNYNSTGTSERNYGRGAVHVHVLLCMCVFLTTPIV